MILIGGATVAPSLLSAEIARGHPVVAADGGANQLRALQIRPHAIVGDMDSVRDKSHWQSSTQLIHVAEQDSTDFEKCLRTVEAPLYLALGFCGDRLDHTLASLHAVARRLITHRVLLVSEHDVVMLINRSAALSLDPGTRFSLFPLVPTRFIRSSGLKYKLDGLTMNIGEQIGTSNETVASQVRLEIDDDSPGCVALIAPLSQKLHFEHFLYDSSQ